MNGLIEGYFVRLNDGSYWVVKGCVQPSYGVIAIPRYVDRIKVKKLSECFKLIEKVPKYSSYLKYLRCLGRRVPVIPYSDISEVFNPCEYMEYIVKYVDKPIYRIALELIEVLNSSLKVRVGLTGSLLIGKATRSSDIDLVIYGVNVELSRQLVQSLHRLFTSGILKHITKDEFIDEVSKVGEVLDLNSYLNIIRYKVLQGVFKGFKYTLRFVTCSKPKICSDVVKDLDYVYLRGFVIDDSQAYLTPVTYIMKVVDTSDKHLRCDDVVKLTSLRIRFTELGVGTYLEVKGRLQKVNDELIINLDFPDSYVKILKYEVPTLIRDLKK